jgi:hypothetical protein
VGKILTGIRTHIVLRIDADKWMPGGLRVGWGRAAAAGVFPPWASR